MIDAPLALEIKTLSHASVSMNFYSL